MILHILLRRFDLHQLVRLDLRSRTLTSADTSEFPRTGSETHAGIILNSDVFRFCTVGQDRVDSLPLLNLGCIKFELLPNTLAVCGATLVSF